MSLKSYEKSAFALRLVAARLLDASYVETLAEQLQVRAASTLLEQRALDASARKLSEAKVREFVLQVANDLGTYVESRHVLRAQRALRELAPAITGDGSGIPLLADTGQCKRSGVLELAAMVETYVREEVARAGSPLQRVPAIRYSTGIGRLSSEFGDFRILGFANIDTEPREVAVKFAEGVLNGRDVNHATYVLFHEIVCHALQGHRGGGSRENAEDDSAWTEGWMDVIAFDMAGEWLSTGPIDWVPARGADASGHIHRYHEGRYEAVEQLQYDRLVSRRNARNCVRAFERLLALKSSSADAKRSVRSFSLLLNTHGSVTVAELDWIAATMWQILRSRPGSSRPALAAAACGNFLADQNLHELLITLTAICTTP